MEPKVYSQETNDHNDWRFMGQDKYLMNVQLVFAHFNKRSESWNHEHCEFCTARFSEYDGDLHEGYSTLDKNWWICEKCYNDFKDMFIWTVTESTIKSE